MLGTNLRDAKSAKNDEFYTQYKDIQKEINAYLDYNPNVFNDKIILLPCDDPEWSNFTKFFAQNFVNFGIKKLISTSYASESKKYKYPHQISLFESESENFNPKITKKRGKIFTLINDGKSKKVDINDLKWNYLEGDGDFQSDEVKKLRDEADFIITNPPFSLYRDFLKWIIEAKKQFLIIGNKNSITYQEIFPLIKDNKIWAGKTSWGGGLWFETKNNEDVDKIVNGLNMKNVSSAWFTNIEHGKRHEFLQLMTLKDNLKYSKHKIIKKEGYKKYDNYNAIEVPFADAIPSDYKEEMGVPVTFIEKYNPDQFEILGVMASTTITEHNFGYPFINGKKVYARIIIRSK
jgi:hypothetical protein